MYRFARTYRLQDKRFFLQNQQFFKVTWPIPQKWKYFVKYMFSLGWSHVEYIFFCHFSICIHCFLSLGVVSGLSFFKFLYLGDCYLWQYNIFNLLVLVSIFTCVFLAWKCTRKKLDLLLDFPWPIRVIRFNTEGHNDNLHRNNFLINVFLFFFIFNIFYYY